MGQKLVIGPVTKGLQTNVLPFNIDNDAFPTLINAYQWRGRVKRKRGTSLLGRLKRFLGTTDAMTGNLTVTILPTPIGTGQITVLCGTNVYTDPGTTANPGTQTLLTIGIGTATLVRSTGVLTISGSTPGTAVYYYPSLPVMGLEDLQLMQTQFPGTLAFDTDYSYNISTSSPYNIYDVSFYKNPAANGLLPHYTAKMTSTPLWWNGQDYQQFWTTNYQGALWATNGVTSPFLTTNIGMQFSGISHVTVVTAGNGTTVPAVINITVSGPNLVVGDFVYLNEFDPAVITGINFQAGYVTAGSAPGIITVTLPIAILAGPGGAGQDTAKGIVQYLTNRSDTTKDCIRWYDGDPTNGNPPNPTQGFGWVNFMPPLSEGDYSIADLPAAQYYLVGCKMIRPFKDQLLFFGPVVQTSSGSPIYLSDAVVFSQNGTPYYTSSFSFLSSTNLFNPTEGYSQVLVPVNQTAVPYSFFEDTDGFGAWIQGGFGEPIYTVGENKDALIVGFSTHQTRLLYQGNTIAPFQFFLINSELGSGSTFSSIVLDQGVMTKGNRGFILTSQTSAERFDLDILDQGFEIQNTNNGPERLCSQRDFINELIYFTYPSNQWNNKYPNQTLLYNYREQTWAIFNECYTTYGTFRRQTGFTWATVGQIYSSWTAWNAPWNASSTTLLDPKVIGGNTQGFILERDDGQTSEGSSLSIQNISSAVITSPNHCLNNSDYIMITGATGTIATEVNGQIFQVQSVTQNTFVIAPTTTGTYTGGGTIIRMYVPFIQSKQFPVAWANDRKTRLGPQKYLFTTTPNAQIQLQLYLSQDTQFPYNVSTIVPDDTSINDSLIYSTIVYTCVESTNLGLSPANITAQNVNLQQISTPQSGTTTQNQIWHRLNTSLIGDTVQFAITLSPDQMKTLDANGNPICQFAEIEFHGAILDVNPSQILA